MHALSWDTAPAMLDAKQAGQLLTLKPVWVRRNLRHLAIKAGPRLLRFPKEKLRQWVDMQQDRPV